MVLCDGLMPECDLYQDSKGPKAKRGANSCNRCQAESAFLTAKSNVSFLWLGRWLEPDTIKTAQSWASRLDDPRTAHFKGWPIGEWVHSSVMSHFRTETLDLDNPKTLALYQRYATGGAIMAAGLDRLYQHEQPDAQLLFNGRMAPTRIALELARQHGITTITEERGFAPGHMRLVRDTHCLDPNPFYALCNSWKNTPLDEAEITALRTLLQQHLQGTGYEITKFAAPTEGPETIHSRLGIDQNKKLAALFTSSTDEPQDQPEAKGCFDHQRDWVRETIARFGSEPSWHLVVRTHPNSGGKRAVGTNQQELEFIDSLAAECPENVSIIRPEDDLSSFDLIQASDCGLIWHSSIGLEMAALGRPVFRAGQYWFRDADFMHTTTNVESYSVSLSDFLRNSSENLLIDNAIAAWRFAYCWFFRQSINFPLVRQPDWATGEAAYQSLEALEPGKDPSLDRVCSIIINNEPIHPEPAGRDSDSSVIERDLIAKFVSDFAKP